MTAHDPEILPQATDPESTPEDDESLLAMASAKMCTASIAVMMGPPWTEAAVYNRLFILRRDRVEAARKAEAARWIQERAAIQAAKKLERDLARVGRGLAVIARRLPVLAQRQEQLAAREARAATKAEREAAKLGRRRLWSPEEDARLSSIWLVAGPDYLDVAARAMGRSRGAVQLRGSTLGLKRRSLIDRKASSDQAIVLRGALRGLARLVKAIPAMAAHEARMAKAAEQLRLAVVDRPTPVRAPVFAERGPVAAPPAVFSDKAVRPRFAPPIGRRSGVERLRAVTPAVRRYAARFLAAGWAPAEVAGLFDVTTPDLLAAMEASQ
jgi:hypothetical protein